MAERRDAAPDKGNGKAARKRKPGVVERAKQQGRELADLGNTAVNAPRELPSKLGHKFRNFLHAMYTARGGGLYATGFVINFLFLEIQTFIQEVQTSTGVGGFFGDQIIHLIFRFTLQSLVNTIESFLWPLSLIQWSPVFGGVALAAAYIVFNRYIKKRLEALLFSNDLQASSDESTG